MKLQYLKKIYAVVYLKYKYNLVLDCDSIFVKPTNVKHVFDTFFDNKFLIYSMIQSKLGDTYGKQMNIKKYFKYSKPCLNFWSDYLWFYDYDITKDLIHDIITKYDNNYNKMFGTISSHRLWESLLYKEFIYNNIEKYEYTLVNVDNIIKTSIPNDIFNKFINKNVTIDNFINFVDYLEFKDLQLLIDNTTFFSVFHINCGKHNLNQPKNKEFINHIIKTSKSMNIVFGLNDSRFPTRDYRWIWS